MTVTPQRAQLVAFTRPYYVEGVGAADQARQQAARSSTRSRRAAADTKVSILQNVDADELVHEALPQAQVMQIDTQANVIQALEAGRVDAAAVDLSTVRWLAKRQPDKYADSGKKWCSMLYGAALRQGDPDWLHFVDTTFNVAMFGHQNEIFDKAVQDFFGLEPPQRETGVPEVLRARNAPLRRAAGAGGRCRLTLPLQLHPDLAILLAPRVGAGALARARLRLRGAPASSSASPVRSPTPTARAGSRCSSRPMSSSSATSPLILLVYLVFYGMPSVGGFSYGPMQSFILTLVGLRRRLPGRGVPRRARRGAARPDRCRQGDRADPGPAPAYVRLPTMLRIVLPSLTNTFISLFKDTSIASVIAVPELTYGAQWINFNTFRIVEVYAVVTPMYWSPATPSCCSLRLLERRYAARALKPLDVALQFLPFLRPGPADTLQVSALVVVLSLVLGVLFGLILVYGPRRCACWSAGYSDLHPRHPDPGPDLLRLLRPAGAQGEPEQPHSAAVTALTVFETAQVIEITRGAIQSIHHGQIEAGKAIGLTFGQRLVYVIFPQAMRRFLPPWINSVTDAVKGSALVSLVGIVDLMLAIQQVIGRIYEPMPLYVLGALIYFAINYSLSSLSRRLERRFAYVRE